MTIIALVMTIGMQGQGTDDDIADIMAAMIAAKIHQDSIDVSNLVAVYNYECKTQDAEGKAVTDRMKICVQVGQHCTRSYPYRKYRMEREWASGQNPEMKNRNGKDGNLEFHEGYDFMSDEDLPLLMSESYCFVPEVWTGYPEGKVTVRDAIPPTIYEAREVRKAIEWEMGTDYATCSLHGRRWTVRYDEDIPTTAGPWKLCGLPGLIVDAVSEDSIHHFTLENIQHVATPIYYETSAITVKIAEKKLIKNRIKTFGNRLYVKNPHYYITDNSSADEVFLNDGMLINGVCVNDKPHVFQPLELTEQ